jgi:hypothetical protein
MTLSWTAPLTDQGCPILSFSIFMDDGTGGSFSEVESSQVNNLPALRSHTITSFQNTDTSLTFRFYMTAVNEVGSITSGVVSFVLAKVPDQPPTVPTLNFD